MSHPKPETRLARPVTSRSKLFGYDLWNSATVSMDALAKSRCVFKSRSRSTMSSVVAILFLLVIMDSLTSATSQMDIDGYENKKACYGTDTGLTKHGDVRYRFEQMQLRYTNCTHVIGNLEVVFVEGKKDYNLSFLSSIKEVSGYVLIAGNVVNSIPLTGLQIIRGNTLFLHSGGAYSLFVALNYEDGGSRGLRELEFTNLSEILKGTVFFQDNKHLCYEHNIDWKDINPFSNPPVIFKKDHNVKIATCGECHESCWSNKTEKRQCWGKGPDKCQKLSFKTCHGNCGNGRCYGEQANQCCSPECAGGCTGDLSTDCFSCRNFLDDGNCVKSCPSLTDYDPIKMIRTKNPAAKYTFGSVCVKKCPQHLLQDQGFCVRHCSPGRDAKDKVNCEACNGACPKRGPVSKGYRTQGQKN